MSPTPTWRSSSAGRWGSGSMSSGSAGCCVLDPASARSSTSWSRPIRSNSIRREGGAGDLLPASMLIHSARGEEVAPGYLGASDHAWLRLLLEERERFVGRPQRELKERLADPLGGATLARQKLAAHVLSRL